MHTIKKLAVATAITTLSLAAQAQVTEVEGSAGGGIVPWALLSGGSPTVSFTYVNGGEYSLTSVALQGSIAKRVELSYARQSFDTAGVGLGHINVDVVGAKVKLHDMANGWPALALGVQYKKTDAPASFLNAVGADDSDTDAYLAATKVVPAGGKNLLLNGTLRYTRANQIGILGFGSATDNDRKLQFEGSAGVFLNKNTVLGAEYRSKPDNINGLKENAWWDIFFAYFPSKNLSVTAAYADLGDIVAEANPAGADQRGLYLQIQANF
jgi:hypothetical protein